MSVEPSRLSSIGYGRIVDPNALTSGEEPFPRYAATTGVSMTSGSVRLTYFTARKTEAITKLRAGTQNVAAAATPSLVKFGVYSVAANGDLTLITATANDTAIFATAGTSYERALLATWNKAAGVYYALAIIVITAVAVPTLHGCSYNNATEMGQAPKLCAALAGQSDMPGSITNPAASVAMPYIVAVP